MLAVVGVSDVNALSAPTCGGPTSSNVSGSPKLEQTLKHPTSVRSAAFDLSGKKVVSGDRAGTVRVWMLGEDKAIGEFQPLGVFPAHPPSPDYAPGWDIFLSPTRVRIANAIGNACSVIVVAWTALR